MDKTKEEEAGQILMKWCLENKHYDVAYYLYTKHDVGIPCSLVYKLPEKYSFSKNETTISSKDPFLKNLIALFPQSRWRRIGGEKNQYGYIYSK